MSRLPLCWQHFKWAKQKTQTQKTHQTQKSFSPPKPFTSFLVMVISHSSQDPQCNMKPRIFTRDNYGYVAVQAWCPGLGQFQTKHSKQRGGVGGSPAEPGRPVRLGLRKVAFLKGGTDWTRDKGRHGETRLKGGRSPLSLKEGMHRFWETQNISTDWDEKLTFNYEIYFWRVLVYHHQVRK